MPGLDERGHDRQLRWQPALLRLAGHPGGDLLLRRVVARVVGRPEVGDLDRGVAPRLVDDGAQAQRVGALGLGGLRELRRGEVERVAGLAGQLAVDAARSSRPTRTRESELLLEADVQMVLVPGVGEVAGPGDRPRRADLVRPDRGVEVLQLHRDLARVEVGRVDRDAVDRRDVDAAAEVVVGDRAAGRELGVVRAHARDGDLVVLAELGEHRDHPRVDPPGLEVGDPVGVEDDVVVLRAALASRASACRPRPRPRAERGRPVPAATSACGRRRRAAQWIVGSRAASAAARRLGGGACGGGASGGATLAARRRRAALGRGVRGGSGGAAGAAWPDASAPWTDGRFTRLSTSPTSAGTSARCGITCSDSSYRPTPSIAAAISTPARLDCDSRTSSVIIALPRAERHLLGELVEPRLAARGRRVAPEARAEVRLGEQALEQVGGDVGLDAATSVTAPQPLPASGRPTTTSTGTNTATQTVAITTHTIHSAGANRSSAAR